MTFIWADFWGECVGDSPSAIMMAFWLLTLSDLISINAMYTNRNQNPSAGHLTAAAKWFSWGCLSKVEIKKRLNFPGFLKFLCPKALVLEQDKLRKAEKSVYSVNFLHLLSGTKAIGEMVYLMYSTLFGMRHLSEYYIWPGAKIMRPGAIEPSNPLTPVYFCRRVEKRMAQING